MAQEILTQERLKELLHYSIISGKFYWQEKGLGRNSDLSAGWSGENGYGYIQICVEGNKYLAHQLAHLYVMGFFTRNIDHINHNGKANWWLNLRPTTRSGNLRNSTLSVKSTTGITGVRRLNNKKSWVASIKVNKKELHLYQGEDLFEACCRRLSANIKYNYHYNHGR